MNNASRSHLVLGVDGGGTSTAAWLANSGGAVIGRGVAGPSNAKAVGLDSARAALDQSIAAAFADAGIVREPARVACLGLAGFDRPDDRALLNAWSNQFAWADHLVTANDGDLVVAAGTPEEWGVGLIAGTGSIAVGRAQDGRKARAGGWGYLIGDEGSAYWVVLQALRQVARRADGRELPRSNSDPLRDRLCRALDVETPDLIVSRLYSQEFDRARIASLATEVVAAAEDDPDAIRPLFDSAAFALAELVLPVARAIGCENGRLPLALAGGFLLSVPIIMERILELTRSHGFVVEAKLVPAPVEGALILAQRESARILA